MSGKQLEISIYNKNSLLIKDYTFKERWKQHSNPEVLSDDIHLPGYESKPFKICVSSSITSNHYYYPYIIIQRPKNDGYHHVGFFILLGDFEYKARACK